MPREKGIRNIFAQIVLAAIPIVLLALAGRVVYINLKLANTQKLLERADHQQQAFIPLPAVRGKIYDRRGRILAGTKIVPSLFADPALNDDKILTADVVGQQLSISKELIIDKLNKDPSSHFVWLARGISADDADGFSKEICKKLGLGIFYEPKRIYTSGTLAGHVLGSVNIDGWGQEGVELYDNKTLAGQDGYEHYIRDAARRKIWLINSQCRSPVNGQNIILSIDSVVQQFTQKILGATCEQYRAESGVAVVMDPRTGEILALASWPEVDPGNFGNTPPDKRRNRVLTDPYEPGSIFKPFIASHALEDGVVKMEDTFFCENGAYTVGRRTLHDAHKMGTLTFPEVVILSSNIGMAKIGQRMGNARLNHAVRSFGFGRKTGIDLPGEDYGLVWPAARWTSFSTCSIPMGQEIAATSLQLVTAFAAIANHGTLLRPRLLLAAIDERGQVTKERTKPEVVNQAIKPEIAKIMVEQILRGVCAIGTGKKADIPGYQVFGKTGTAQIAKSSGKGKGHFEENAYVASFMGGAPASNPQVVVIVSIRRPDKKIGHYGGTVSAPAVKEILQSYFDYEQIPPVEAVDNMTKKAEEKGDFGF
ncbi:MAG: penicillin-binding protein 2 [Phycisphaerae bacterium]